MMGCWSVSSQIRKNTNAMSATTASPTMNGELNQSRSLPLSSMICSAATQVMSETRPILSMGSLRVADSRSR